jgi:hypothetical protein
MSGMTSSFASQDHVFPHCRHKKVLPTTRSRTFKAVHNQFVRFLSVIVWWLQFILSDYSFDWSRFSHFTFSSHSSAEFIFIDIQEVAPGYSVSYLQSGLYADLVGYYSTVLKGVPMILLLIIFGIWTWRNLQNVHRGWGWGSCSAVTGAFVNFKYPLDSSRFLLHWLQWVISEEIFSAHFPKPLIHSWLFRSNYLGKSHRSIGRKLISCNHLSE